MLARRRQVEHWALLGQRVGYLLFGIAVVVFVVGFAIGFTGSIVAVIVASLVIGSLLLAPPIVAGYAVKAADREDRENNR